MSKLKEKALRSLDGVLRPLYLEVEAGVAEEIQVAIAEEILKHYINRDEAETKEFEVRNEAYEDGFKSANIVGKTIPISEVEEWLKVDHPKGIVDAKPFYECLDYIAERLEQYKRNKEEVGGMNHTETFHNRTDAYINNTYVPFSEMIKRAQKDYYYPTQDNMHYEGFCYALNLVEQYKKERKER